ncbi:MAG: HAD family hydrolase, partial [Actinomycetales bacterium]
SVLVAVAVVTSAVWVVLRGLDDGVVVAVAATVGLAGAGHVVAPGAALLVGRRRAAQLGVRLESLRAAQRAALIDTVVLDQDGTVTTGRLRVTSVKPLEPDHERNLRWFAGALSHAGDHPISQAIAQLSARGHVAEVQHVDGRGVLGSVDRHPVRVGSPAWLGAPAEESLWRTVAVEVDSRVLGTLEVADDIREKAPESVRRLRDLGLDVHLVSASRPDRAEHVALTVGLTEAHHGSAADLVQQLTAEGRSVAVASSTSVDGALPLSTTAGHDGIVLDDLDVRRVGQALETARTVTAGVARGRTVATIGTVVGVAVAAAGLAGPDLTAGVAALSTAAAAFAATR